MSAEWERGRWWRVVYADGRRYGDGRRQVWSETSVESEARRDLETCPGGGVLQQLWERHEHQWRDDEPPPDEPAETSGPDWSAILPLSDEQGYVLDDLREGRGLCGRSTRVMSRLRTLGLIERDPAAAPDVDGDRHRLTEIGSTLATVLAEHRLTTSRRTLGSGALAGSRTRYGVNAECACRQWKGYSNESASNGGDSSVRHQHAEHLAGMLATLAVPAAADQS